MNISGIKNLIIAVLTLTVISLVLAFILVQKSDPSFQIALNTIYGLTLGLLAYGIGILWAISTNDRTKEVIPIYISDSLQRISKFPILRFISTKVIPFLSKFFIS